MVSRGPKPAKFCSRDGCNEYAKWECELVLRNTPIRALASITVCNKHKSDAEAYILNDENKSRLVRTLVAENYAPEGIAQGTVRYNAYVYYKEIPQEEVVNIS